MNGRVDIDEVREMNTCQEMICMHAIPRGPSGPEYSFLRM